LGSIDAISPDTVAAAPYRWIAAARARNGTAPDPLLISAGFADPGFGNPQQVSLTWAGLPDEDLSSHYGYWAVRVVATHPNLPGRWDDLLVRSHWYWDGQPFHHYRAAPWSGWIWPENPEPFTANRLDAARFRAYAGAEVDPEPLWALQTLRRITGALGPVSTALLGFGLGAASVEERLQAAELLSEAVPDRLSVADLAGSLAFLVPHLVLGRLAASLGQAAAIAEPVADAVRQLLTALLPTLDRSQRDIGKLLNLLLDETMLAGTAITDPRLRDWLAGFTGSGVAAKAAHRLLDLAAIMNGEHR
jgi:hypothetical protein